MTVPEIKAFLAKYPDEIQTIFTSLPMRDWEVAAEIAMRGYNKGYYAFGVWEGWDLDEYDNGYTPLEPTINDIVAVNPETGFVEFLRNL